MTRSWTFGDLEFVVLWELFGEDRLPHPFVFTSRTPMYFDYLREKREVAERLRTGADAAIAPVAESMVRPDIRITVDGWAGRDPERADARIRILATRKGDRGYVAIQLPGETYTHSGGFVVAECDPLRLADAIVAALPTAEPGDATEIALLPPEADREGLDYEYGRSPTRFRPEETLPGRSRRFLRTTPSLIGTIDIEQGMSKFGPRGITRHRLEWRDLSDDGRYVIAHAAPWVAVSADHGRLTSMINVRIADVVKVIREERDGRGADS
ncbi:ESX secretion-associated protein EspG [Nocardia sp. CC227C]|uniref:ESX secretion-associated protein EspG n=1 Tax=Nocardia sp. CC227C TaxID=3044562 RepID=UPI00278BC82A|nr:ESX secretion-associated protein EspG [Nocardia sp. CC227C]